MSIVSLLAVAAVIPGPPQVLVQFGPMSSFCSSAGSSNAGVRFNNDGSVDVQSNCGAFSFDQNYLSIGGGTEGDDFEIMLSVDAFTGPTGGDSIDTWLPLTSNRSWTWTGFNEFNMGDWQIQVREVANISNNDSEIYGWQIEDGS